MGSGAPVTHQARDGSLGPGTAPFLQNPQVGTQVSNESAAHSAALEDGQGVAGLRERHSVQPGHSQKALGWIGFCRVKKRRESRPRGETEWEKQGSTAHSGLRAADGGDSPRADWTGRLVAQIPGRLDGAL